MIIVSHLLQAGIGTYTSPDIATPFMAKVEKVNIHDSSPPVEFFFDQSA
jgi:hypothetical protein